MESSEQMNRHLLDLCRRSDRTLSWVYSGFLTPAEQEDFIRCPEAARFDWCFDGGYEAAERRLLAVSWCTPSFSTRIFTHVPVDNTELVA